MITIAAASAVGIIAEKHQSILLASVGLMILIGLWRLKESTRWARWAILMSLVASTAAVRSGWDESRFQTAAIRELITDDLQPAIVVGKVSGLVQRVARREQDRKEGESPWVTRFNVHVCSVRQGNAFHRCTGRLWVSVDADVEYVGSGDTLRLSGKIATFWQPTNPGEADMRLVARNHRQHGRLFVRDARQVETIRKATWGLSRLANRISLRGEQTLMNCLGEDTGALAAALVVGRRGSMNPQLQDQLLETGTIHLLSVSGLHMGIVAMLLRFLATSLGLRGVWQILFVGVCCLLFVAVTGARPPVMRAAMLVGVVLAASAFDRQSLPLNSLAMAAVALMLINPTDLTRVGVQLSFVAVATLVSCGHRYRELDEDLRTESQLDRLAETAASPLRRRLRWCSGKLNNALWFSLCVTLTTTPLVWMHFNLVTPVAVIANVLLGVPMTVALLSGLLAVVCATVSDGLAYPAGEVCYAALWIMQRMIEVAANVAWGHFWLPGPPWWWVAAYYALLVGGFSLVGRRHRAAIFVIGSIAWCLIAWWLAVLPSQHRPQELRATFLDVGHGTSVVLNLPDGRNLLYDCGSLGNQSYSSRGFHEPLWSQGITRLDAVILSHADADHYNALPGLLRRFRIAEVVVPTGMFDSSKVGLVPIREAISAANVPVREVSSESEFLDLASADGERWTTIRVLHPPPLRVAGNDNANSLVLRIDFGGRSLILPGDLEPPGLEMVLNRPRPIAGGVLMSPHHGSLTVNSQAILDWARPRQVIVSGGSRAKRPEVAEALRVRGSEVFVTAELGAIRVTLPANRTADPSKRSADPQASARPETQTTVRAWLRDPW